MLLNVGDRVKMRKAHPCGNDIWKITYVGADIKMCCEKCSRICPAHAITMVKGQPKIDRRACIGCFCCQEFCPKGALEAKRAVIARILTRS